MAKMRNAGLRLAAVEIAVQAVRDLAPNANVAREAAKLWRAEVVASTTLAGSTLESGEVDSLLDHGLARGDHPLAQYLVVRAYADAARWVADQRVVSLGDPQPLLTVEDLRHLHARVSAGSSLHPGAWRQSNPAPRAGVVSPAAWLVPREVDAAIDQLGRGPYEMRIAMWIARFMGRVARIRPFEGANGRTARLAANLMLRRFDFQPIVYERAERLKYVSAIAAAESGDPAQLADIIVDAIMRSCNQLRAAARASTDPLATLRELAGDSYTMLAKAAQRGTLRTVTRGGRYYTTRDWIENYRLTHQRARSVRPEA